MSCPKMNRRRDHLIVQISFASVARFASLGLLALRGLLLAHLLGPAVFGIWSAMRLILQFGMFGHIGTRTGFLRDATLAVGAGDHIEAKKLREAAGTVNLIGALVIAGVVSLVVLLNRGARADGLVVWMMLSGLIVLRHQWLYSQIVLQSARRYSLRSSLVILVDAISTGVGALAAYFYGLAGFLAAQAMSYGVGILLAHSNVKWLPVLRLDIPRSVALIRSGLPIMLSNLTKTLLWSLDKLFIWVFMGTAALGIYALQATFTSMVLLFPGGVTDVIYPHMLTQLGKSDALPKARKFLVLGSDLLARVMCPVLAVTFLALHLPIRWLLPEYVDAIPPGLIMVLAAFWAVDGRVPGMILPALGGQVKLFLYTVIAVIVAAGAIGVAIVLDSGYIGVALGASTGLLCRSVLITSAALRLTGTATGEQIRFARQALENFGLLVLVIVIVTFIVPDVSDSAVRDCLYTALRCALASLVLVPRVWSAWRDYEPHLREARQPTIDNSPKASHA